MPEFYIIIARKIFLPNFRGHVPPPPCPPPSATPMSVCLCCRLYDMQGDDEEGAEKIPSVAERIKQMESKKIRFSAMREKAAKRRYDIRHKLTLAGGGYYTSLMYSGGARILEVVGPAAYSRA